MVLPIIAAMRAPRDSGGAVPSTPTNPRKAMLACENSTPKPPAPADSRVVVQARRLLERQLANEHRIATQLQVSLMPETLPVVPGVDVASGFRPAGDGQGHVDRRDRRAGAGAGA